MKKILPVVVALLLTATMFPLTSCNPEIGNKGDKTAQSDAKKHHTPADTANLPNYRYVDQDTLLAHYNLAKDYSEQMLQLQNQYENTARQRQGAIQSLASQYQQKAQNNGYLSQDAYEADMKNLQSRQSAAENELGKLQVSMQNQMANAQKIINDSIESYIAEYNKARGYDAIFMKAATIYINPDLDITQEVVDGLNARYNKVKK